MSDNNRRNKKYKNNSNKERGDRRERDRDDPPIQPKILLKVKDKDSSSTTQNLSSTSSAAAATSSQSQPQISIASREIESSSKSSQSPNTTSGTTNNNQSSSISSNTNQQSTATTTSSTPNTTQSSDALLQPVPQMTKPITIISYSSNQVNPNAIKVLQKTNTDFLVVGVIGCQGVGKSTILNLLAYENTNYNIKQNLFQLKDAIFPVKIKPGKAPSLPRTESLHMYITEDRIILLDLPPVLSNPSKKDGTANEIDDIRNITLLLTVCHLVIVVQDDYFNLNLIRLLQFAELSKPVHETKPMANSDYFPNLLFVKNKGKREDFLPANIEKAERMLKYFFKDSQMRIYFGQTDKQKRKDFDSLNYFIFPEVTDNDSEMILYHPKINTLADDLRNRVFLTPRNQIYNGNNDLNEALWFELLTVTSMGKDDFFLTTYEDTRRYHTHTTGDQMVTKNSGLNFIDPNE